MAETADMCPLSLAVDFFPRPSVLTVARTFLINSNLDPMEWIGSFGTGSLMRNLLSLSLSVVFITVCAVLPCAVQGQTQDSQTHQNQSVAEVARRNREQMKNAVRQSSVITNDDLDTEHSKPGKEGFNVGAPASLPTEAPSGVALAAVNAANMEATSTNKQSSPKSKESEEAAAEDAEIARLKDKLAEAQNQLEWQQRELVLDQHTIFSNPNYTAYRTGQAKLDSEQERINERQQEIEALKGPLAELEWRQRRRKQAAGSKSSSPVENYKSAPPPTPTPPQP